jgi:hypothetical protein
MEPIKSGWESAGGNLVKNTQTGQMVDIYHPVYTNYTPPGTAGAPAPAGATGPQTSQQAVTGTGTVGTQLQPGQQTTVAGAFQQALLNKLGQGPVTAQSPQVQPAIQANQLAEQRGLERNRQLLAEQNAASGINMSGGNNAMQRGLVADSAMRQGQFAGNAIQDAQRLQSAELLAALGTAGGALSDIDRQQLQRYGIDLDAQLRREGLGATTSLGEQDLALRQLLGTGNLNLGLLGLLQGGQQFGQQLGLTAGIEGARLNQAALATLLGGL